jgi:hypothetical protein
MPVAGAVYRVRDAALCLAELPSTDAMDRPGTLTTLAA